MLFKYFLSDKTYNTLPLFTLTAITPITAYSITSQLRP